ncbi:MAG: hypothetical protein HUJ62_04955, partial [Streptococcus gallolyticus]|nr:hypothetical protein [Streptococcus gallolyticus]
PKEKLKAEILQVAQHGLNGGYAPFYRLVGAEITLVPISRSGAKAMSDPTEDQVIHNRFAENLSHTVVRSFTGNFSVEI